MQTIVGLIAKLTLTAIWEDSCQRHFFASSRPRTCQIPVVDQTHWRWSHIIASRKFNGTCKCQPVGTSSSACSTRTFRRTQGGILRIRTFWSCWPPFVATFRVARLTLQTRKLWCRDRPKRQRRAARFLLKKTETRAKKKTRKKKHEKKRKKKRGKMKKYIFISSSL